MKNTYLLYIILGIIIIISGALMQTYNKSLQLVKINKIVKEKVSN
jgi:hypothetical protein